MVAVAIKLFSLCRSAEQEWRSGSQRNRVAWQGSWVSSPICCHQLFGREKPSTSTWLHSAVRAGWETGQDQTGHEPPVGFPRSKGTLTPLVSVNSSPPALRVLLRKTVLSRAWAAPTLQGRYSKQFALCVNSGLRDLSHSIKGRGPKEPAPHEPMWDSFLAEPPGKCQSSLCCVDSPECHMGLRSTLHKPQEKTD